MSQANPRLDTLAANSSRCRLALVVINAIFTPRWRRVLRVSIAPGSGWSPRYNTPSMSIATCLITCIPFPVSHYLPYPYTGMPLRRQGGRYPMSINRHYPPRSIVLRNHSCRSILPTPTVPTRLTWAGFVDRERAIVERGAIEGRDGGFGLIGIRHFHEPETT